jgi:hypothetical protein
VFVYDPLVSDLPERSQDALLPARDDLPPVVARMVVEIRSDGTRTMARGALEDLESGQVVTVEAGAPTPLELSRMLVKTLLASPQLASQVTRDALRAVVPERIRRSRLRRLLPWRDPE